MHLLNTFGALQQAGAVGGLAGAALAAEQPSPVLAPGSHTSQEDAAEEPAASPGTILTL